MYKVGRNKVGSKLVVFKIDTGADITAISKSIFDSLPNKPKLHPCKRALFSPGGKLQSVGNIDRNKKYENYMFVTSGEHEK